jgi:hypothetical protein
VHLLKQGRRVCLAAAHIVQCIEKEKTIKHKDIIKC